MFFEDFKAPSLDQDEGPTPGKGEKKPRKTIMTMILKMTMTKVIPY